MPHETQLYAKVTTLRRCSHSHTGDPSKVHLCSSILAIGFHPSGQLYVVDAYSGLYSINTTTGEQTLVWSSSNEVQGAPPCKILNSFEVLSNGSILMSDSSSRFRFHEFLLDIMDGHPSGKLFVFNPEQGETHVLLDGISFANGILLSKDESFVLVVETGRFRILRCVAVCASEGGWVVVKGEAAKHIRMVCTLSNREGEGFEGLAKCS